MRGKWTCAALMSALLALVAVPGAQAAVPKQAFLSATKGHSAKVPSAFGQRLRYALPDGTLRVMVATGRRTATLERLVRANTTWSKWYSASAPRFLARVTPRQLTTLLSARGVRFVEPDYPLRYFADTPTQDIQARSLNSAGTGVWSFDPAAGDFGALTADAAGLTADQATGKGTTVAIIDSGIDGTFQDFGRFDCLGAPYQPCDSRIKRTVVADHLVGDGADIQGLPTTEAFSGHGTHVAGIIAGNGMYSRNDDADAEVYGGDGLVFGVAPQASLISVKNGDTIWAGLSSFGLQWVLDHAKDQGIRVVNNSWGCLGGCAYDPQAATSQLFKDLYEAGVLVVFAAGNDAGDPDGASFSGNAQSPYVLGVANYDHTTHQLSESSSRGVGTTTLADPATWTPQSEPATGVRRPDVGAPGELVWSARTLTGGAASLVPRVGTTDALGGGTNGIRPYAQMSGTSMATPHVVGAGAVLFSACPQSTPLDVMRAIMAGATAGKVLKTGSTTPAEPFETGYGALDVRASLDWLRTQPSCGGAAPATTVTSAKKSKKPKTAR
jgi:subtilisin family serine protease